jgi:hypothetical protein
MNGAEWEKVGVGLEHNIYGLGPGLLYNVHPDEYYTNYCKLVHGMRLMNQHRITHNNLCQAYLALTSFTQEFEIIYCQCLATQIHFVQPCIHSLMHFPHEVIHLGPPICSSQWTLKRTIRNLGKEIKQHSNPFANLSQHGIRRTWANALMAMILDLDLEWTTKAALPQSLRDVRGGVILLRPRESASHALQVYKAAALQDFMLATQMGDQICVRCWAKLRIPTG